MNFKSVGIIFRLISDFSFHTGPIKIYKPEVNAIHFHHISRTINAFFFKISFSTWTTPVSIVTEITFSRGGAIHEHSDSFLDGKIYGKV